MDIYRRKVIFAFVAALLIATMASEFQAYFWSHDFARKTAYQKVVDDCIRTSRDPRLLSHGQEQSVGNAVWSFEWTYEGQPRHFIGTRISRDGHIELFTGAPDDPNSAAYQTRPNKPTSPNRIRY